MWGGGGEGRRRDGWMKREEGERGREGCRGRVGGRRSWREEGGGREGRMYRRRREGRMTEGGAIRNVTCLYMYM